jgi:hypothetical protein
VSSLQNVFVKWAQGAWNFVIDCAGKIWNFVVKTAGQALRAIRWLLEDVLHILITAIIDAVGFLFRWQDILDTHDLLVHVTNKGLDWMAEGAGLLAEGVDFLLDDVKKIITDFTTPDSMKDKSFGASATYSGEAQKEGEVLNSPGGNWGSYQMQHGGTTKSLESDKTEGIFPQEIIDELGTMVEQVISKFTTLIPTISANLSKLNTSMSKASIGDILMLVGRDVALACVDGLGELVKGLLRTLAAVIKIFKKALNAKIQLPLLTNLCKRISGNDLSALDAMALLIAVPTTLLFKAFLGRAPRDLPRIKELLEQLDREKKTRLDEEATIASTTILSEQDHFVDHEQSRPNDTEDADARVYFNEPTFEEIQLASRNAQNQDKHIPKRQKFQEHEVSSELGMPINAMKIPFNANDLNRGIVTLQRDRYVFKSKLVEWTESFIGFLTTYYKDLLRFGAIVGGWYSALMLPVNIFGEDMERPGFGKGFAFGLVIDVVIFLGTCPLNPFVSGEVPMLFVRSLN